MTMAQTRQVEEWPATPIQRWMRAYDEDNPASGYYVLPFTWSIAGQVDRHRLTATFEAMCARYPVLLAGMRRAGGSWTQAVRPYSEVPVHFRDATAVSGEERDRLLQDSYREYCRRPFRLTEEPPIRVLVVQLATEAVVMGAFHQVACDIESMAVFNAELALLYEAYLHGTEPALPAPGLDFGAYASRAWSARRVQEVDNLAFWRDRLAGVDLRTAFPVDFPEAAARPVGPAEYFKIGGPPTAVAVHELARESRCSEHAIVLGAFTKMLAGRSGRSSFVLSCPITLRRSAELFRTFGPMTDLMWLRIDVAQSASLADHCRVLFRGILDALGRPCPIDAVAERAGTAPDGRPAVPNLQCQYFPAERIANPTWVESSVKVKQVMPVYLLTGPLDTPFWLDLTIAGEAVQACTDYSLVYRTDLFRPETVREMADEIEATILGGVDRGV